jgi:serine/threonine protein kinase
MVQTSYLNFNFTLNINSINLYVKKMAKKLGSGSYGKVYLKDGKAVKTFEKLPHLIQEYTMLKYLEDCEYVLHSYGANFHEKSVEMELYSMSLRDYIREYGKQNEDHIIKQILYGLIELHDRGLTHGDIKPGNILVNTKDMNNVKCVIGDCGFVSLSKYSKVERTANRYRDISISSDEYHDMFSLAIILLEWKYEIEIHGKDKKTYSNLEHKIKDEVKNEKEKKLLLCMTNRDKTKRITAREYYYKMYSGNPKNTFKIERYTKHMNKYLKHEFENYTNYMNFNRWKKGYYSLASYISKNKIDKSEYTKYCVVSLYILSCIFSKRYELTEEDIIIYVSNHSKECDMEEIYVIFDKLLKDKIFIKMIMEM